MWGPRLKSFPYAIVGIALSVSACTSTGTELSSFGSGSTIDLPATVSPFPDAEVLKVAKAQFAEGNYGHAARYYERAVEVAPNDAGAWLGLAASYDRIRRFDLADRAYREAGRLAGGRAEYYNNVGYSYLLRGDVVSAHTQFLRAYELDQTNPVILNNLGLVQMATRKPAPSKGGLLSF